MPAPLNVLILEDWPADAELMLYALRQAGFDPDWQCVETEADYLSQLDRDLDVILADHALPRFDALRALHLLQKRNLDIPFIIVSGHISEEMAVECMKQGAADYLLKDRLARLGPAVAHAMQEKKLRDEKRRAEEALRESERRYALATSAGQVGVWDWNLETNEIYLDPNLKAMLGYADHEIQNHVDDWNQLVHPDDVEKVMAAAGAHFEGSTSHYEIVRRMLHKDGSIRWFLARGTAMWDANEKLYRVVGTDTDITERKQAEEALIHNLKERLTIEETLRQRNRELALLHQANQAFTSTLDLDQVLVTVLEEVRHVLDAAACSVWLIDPQTGELVCQQAAGPHSEIVRGWRLAPGEGLAGWVAHSGESLIVPDAYADERYFRGVDQQTKLSLRSLLSVPLRVKQKVIGVLQVVDTEVDRFDETHLTLLEPLSMAAAVAIENARLYEETDRLRAFNENIVQSMEEGIVLYDATGHITFANPRTAELLGYAPQELVGLHWKDCVAPEHVAQTEHEVVKWTQGTTSRFESEWLTQDDHHVPVIVSARPLFDKGHLSSVLVALTDITERKQAEERIKATLQEKEVLLKEIHHRVKNNLQVISSLLDLQSDHIRDEQALRIFKDSRNRVRSMALIHERLYQSRDLARIDFAAYIQALASYLFHSYNVDSSIITLETAVDDVSLDVSAAIPCGLIISELVSNALKHAFPAGERGTIRVVLCADDGRLVLTVGDDGIGLPQDLDWRNTESLGLQLANMLTGQLEGTIELDRSNGTAFTITFPSKGDT